MKFTVLTLFPEMFVGPFDHSIIKRAKEKKLIEIDYLNIRDFATDSHKSVDDHPYGGGIGMVMKVDVVDRAIQKVKQLGSQKVILLDPRGRTYTQQVAKDLTQYQHLALLCGHYEGFDERIRLLVDETISIGDYVVTGGEIPTMMIVDSVTRLLPEVLTQEDATTLESFSEGLLEYPQYTRPPEYQGMKVPEILLSGNHAKIKEWQREQSLQLTKTHRPDLIK